MQQDGKEIRKVLIERTRLHKATPYVEFQLLKKRKGLLLDRDPTLLIIGGASGQFPKPAKSNLLTQLADKEQLVMSAANDLIERMEKETGQRIDNNDGDNNAIAGLLGAMSRLLAQSPTSYTERDDVAAGILIKHRMTSEYQREQENKDLLASLLISGMSPDDVKGLMGNLHNKKGPAD